MIDNNLIKFELQDNSQNINATLEDNSQVINVNLGDSPLPGTDDYNNLLNKPQINNVTLQGNMTLTDLGIEGDKHYIHIQSTASDNWLINHQLNKYPAVTVIDSAENEVIGEVEYLDRNNLRIKFKGGFSGKATLN